MNSVKNLWGHNKDVIFTSLESQREQIVIGAKNEFEKKNGWKFTNFWQKIQ